MGDPPRLIMLEAVLAEIKREALLGVVSDSGAVLLSGLEELAVSKQTSEITISFQTSLPSPLPSPPLSPLPSPLPGSLSGCAPQCEGKRNVLRRRLPQS